ncbi:general secretion pathway protein GspM [Photobacterium jeanii]|uniref:Type II secretion system protein M n=1 Tax=Photobacterium jeanii TaxID=858640 RepID=A0A178KP76_9GAMM|nr:type II secretion system protein M [Photobacterium jeanii]OAN19218.1 general secretion pathway protein GspM [Photobacterium jeanii]PST87226.1 type II secretion system protein M [Photobacterium jeanii]
MKAWWKALSLREQRLMMGAGGALLLAILYWGLWQPLAQRADMAQQRINSERQLLSWVSNKANDIISLRGSSSAGAGISDKGLNQVVNETTTRFRIELIRMQPRSEAVQVWVKPVPFNTLVNWLAFLRDEHGIEAQFLDITKADQNGVVEVNRLQLGRG